MQLLYADDLILMADNVCRWRMGEVARSDT